MSIRELVLILDDDQSILPALERGLRVRGYDTEAFSCVTDFLDRARIEESRCLVLDINLKGGTGIDFACKLKKMGHLLPIVVITASDSEATRQAALRTGCVA